MRTYAAYESQYYRFKFWYDLLPDGDPIWAGGFAYHPYKELWMRCCDSCVNQKAREERSRRRRNRLIEKKWENY